MAKSITVTALKPLLYQGRSHVRGSVFEATPVDAASLKYRGFVKLGPQARVQKSGAPVPEHPSITERLEPVEGFQQNAPVPADQPPVAEVVEAVAEPVEAPTADAVVAPTTRRARRAYQRRDMQAEPSSE